MNMPDFALPVLTIFQPTCSTPTYNRFLVLLVGALLTTGRRTITNLLRIVGHQAPGHMSSSHRVFSRRHWSPWALAQGLLRFLLAYVVPTDPVFLAGDDTVAERPGPTVCGKGRHRDGVRSTHRDTAYRWGHTWVVVSVLIKLPVATRPWALPALVAWYRAPEWDEARGTCHNTPAHLARLLLARLIRWFPERHFVFVGDTGYGTSEPARFCRQHLRHLTLISQFYGDAALSELPPPRTPTTLGRPRVKGRKLLSPKEVVAPTTPRPCLTVAWYGGTTRNIKVVTGTGYWYRIGAALVAVRWVDVHACTGTPRDAYFLTTEVTMSPQQSVEGYPQRWSIETTFQACRAYLKLASTKCSSQQTVLRFIPGLFGLDTLVVVLYLQLPQSLQTPGVVYGRGTSTVTFSDMLSCVRRTVWQQWFFHTHRDGNGFSKRSPALQATLLDALAPAA
jgi:hypothetical protein